MPRKQKLQGRTRKVLGSLVVVGARGRAARTRRLLRLHSHDLQHRQLDHVGNREDRPARGRDDALQRHKPEARRRDHRLRACHLLGLAGLDGPRVHDQHVTNGSLYNLKVERGSGLSSPDNTMNCTGFSASSTAYNGALGTFASTYTDYASGVAGKSADAAWATNDAVDYKFTITQNDDATANAHTSATSSGSHTFVWEARNKLKSAPTTAPEAGADVAPARATARAVRAMTVTPLKLMKLAAFGAGVAAALLALTGWRVERGPAPAAGTLVRVTAQARGGLAVARPGKCSIARSLRAAMRPQPWAQEPGAGGDVHVRALAPAGAVGDTVRVAVRVGKTSLFRGSIAGLANWTVASARLEPGQRDRDRGESLDSRRWPPSRSPGRRCTSGFSSIRGRPVRGRRDERCPPDRAVAGAARHRRGDRGHRGDARRVQRNRVQRRELDQLGDGGDRRQRLGLGDVRAVRDEAGRRGGRRYIKVTYKGSAAAGVDIYRSS